MRALLLGDTLPALDSFICYEDIDCVRGVYLLVWFFHIRACNFANTAVLSDTGAVWQQDLPLELSSCIFSYIEVQNHTA